MHTIQYPLECPTLSWVPMVVQTLETRQFYIHGWINKLKSDLVSNGYDIKDKYHQTRFDTLEKAFEVK